MVVTCSQIVKEQGFGIFRSLPSHPLSVRFIILFMTFLLLFSLYQIFWSMRTGPPVSFGRHVRFPSDSFVESFWGVFLPTCPSLCYLFSFPFLEVFHTSRMSLVPPLLYFI
ncbi:hypothetical protein BDQ17DRAFT_368660 [Cyathus striatus]|nr:hypothetical protein BDQ17DRAFT_368660 [Cyathus striatus]